MKKYTSLLLCLLTIRMVCAQVNLINNGAEVFIDTSTNMVIEGDFENENNGVFDNDGTLEIEDDFINTATFNQDTGLVIFNGPTSQQLSGDTSTFYFLEVDNTNGVEVISGVFQLSHTMIMTSGSFATNDSLILLSDSNLTGRIAEIPLGANVSGHITQQRYLDNGVTGWHLIGTATSGGDLSQWSDDFITSGFPGSAAPSFPFNNIHTYLESDTSIKDTGYYGASNITDLINTGVGYWSYIGPVPLTLDSKGPAHTFGQSLPVSYTVNKDNTHDGWNMVANPYPSNISWDEPGWAKINIDNAIYFYDPDNGVYASYVSGVGTNGGGPVIASSQGFWVKANAMGAVLTVTEPVKTDVSTTFYRKKAGLSKAPLLRLKVQPTLGGLSDETVLAFWNEASGDWDAAFDAYKLEDNFSPAPYIATVLDTVDLSVNALPEIANEGEIPLRVKVKSSGNYEILIARKGDIDMGNCLYLEDLFNDSITDLKTAFSYSFFITDSIQDPRFLIHTNPKPDLGPDTFIRRGGSVLLDAGEGFVSYFWSNGSTSQKLEVTEPGTYSVQVENQFGCQGNDEVVVDLDTSATGISDVPKDDVQFGIYPNPVSNFFFIKTEGLESGLYTLSIYTATGALVYKHDEFIDENKQSIKINARQLAQGFYHLTLNGPSGTFVRQLSVSR